MIDWWTQIDSWIDNGAALGDPALLIRSFARWRTHHSIHRSTCITSHQPMAHVLLASMRGRSIVPSIRRTFTRVFAPRRCFASSGSHDGAAVPLAFGDHELDLIQQKLSQLQRRRIKASAERYGGWGTIKMRGWWLRWDADDEDVGAGHQSSSSGAGAAVYLSQPASDSVHLAIPCKYTLSSSPKRPEPQIGWARTATDRCV